MSDKGIQELKEEMKGLKNVVVSHQTQEISAGISTLRKSVNHLKEPEKKPLTEDEEKVWSVRISNACERLENIISTSIDIKKHANTAIEEIIKRAVMFLIFISVLVCAQGSYLTEEEIFWWDFPLVVLMVCVDIYSGPKLWKISSQLKDQVEDQVFSRAQAKVLIAKVSQVDCSPKLEAEKDKLQHLIYCGMLVEKLHFNYWATFFVSCALTIGTPVMLQAHLDTIVRTSTHFFAPYLPQRH